MNQLFIPISLSNKLKELGFQETCIAIDNGDKLFYAEFKHTHEYYKDHARILYPQAIDWIRKTLRIDISANISTSGNFAYQRWLWLEDAKGWSRDHGVYGFETYEEAINNAITKTLTPMKAETKGGVVLEEIKLGDIHYEFEYGIGIKTEVITQPERIDDGEYVQWKWQAKNVNNPEHIINYLVTEGLSHYGPNLYDHEAYMGVKYI